MKAKAKWFLVFVLMISMVLPQFASAASGDYTMNIYGDAGDCDGNLYAEVNFSSDYEVSFGTQDIKVYSNNTLVSSSLNDYVIGSGTYGTTLYMAIGSNVSNEGTWKVDVSVPVTELTTNNSYVATASKTFTCVKPNLITNGDFSNQANGWTYYKSSSAAATFSTSTGEAVFNITNGGTYNYHIRLHQNLSTIMKAGKTYTISFDAKATANRTIDVGIHNISTGSAYWAKWQLAIGTTKQTYTYTYTPTADVTNAKFEYKLGANNNGVTIDNISIK